MHERKGLHMNFNENEPIAAISTPYGRGGIAVIRISGEHALEIAEKMFVPFGNSRLSLNDSNKAIYGKILYKNEQIDDGIATVFRAPNSFTGEETVEISCHGGIVLANTVLESAILSGCRYADKGEFTKRAFMNGKISLSQAEAVIGLIDAQSKESIRLSSAQSRGILSNKIEEIRSELTSLIASVYAYIDYPDEDLTDLTVPELKEGLILLLNEMTALNSTYKIGKAVCDGILTAIVGKPNTGKSSILNRIIGKEKAIVTNIAGTTRDTVEETVNVGKVILRLCDTAGIHNTTDTIERLGVEKSKQLINESELIIAVFDSSSPLDSDDREILNSLKNVSAEKIFLLNKSDEKCNEEFDEIFACGSVLFVSAKNGEGFEELIKHISDMFVSEKIDYNNTAVISNIRQNTALSLACENVRSALNALENGYTQDVAGLDLELALGKLGELDGREASLEVTDCIFSRFCVGK